MTSLTYLSLIEPPQSQLGISSWQSQSMNSGGYPWLTSYAYQFQTQSAMFINVYTHKIYINTYLTYIS